MDKRLTKKEDESFVEYSARCYRLKENLNLNNLQVYDIIKENTGTQLSESSVRCPATNFNQGYYCREKEFATNGNEIELKKLDEKIKELDIARKKMQATKVEYNRNNTKDARYELFYENVRDAIETLPLPKFDKIQIHNDNNGEYLLALSDIHYNADFESDNNCYSRDEVKLRFEILLEKTKQIVKKNKISHITVIGLGDSIQGMLRISDVKLNDVPVVHAVVEVSRLIATFLNELSKCVYITYRHTMNSNHSQCRYLGTKANEMPSEDMEYIIGNYISDLVSENKRIEVKLSLYDYDSFSLCGQNIITLHGHQIKNIKEVIKDFSVRHKRFYDLCFMGHFHGGQSLSVGELNGNTEIVVCPSFVGSDPYADKLMVGSKAMCKLFKIEENVGITETYTMVLN
ncbi:hypothetical protein PMX22_15885 [Clostridium butyricum]|jgi:hypothetical protein|uniref:hypothetical protein n=1 Tax=Clostridium butyricum TaxID=1492 RepID=UPI002048CD57|nr:hypothetical protein [Clostridium butyricum]MDB2161272.1 hypothetical protein [Clostridium butyricum]DAQ97524.1 MAG TPA: DNA polymerase II small subunit [Caudoviricetes sp.]